jgi:enamine deaminase RidA (YjgF/YER057c/UK114 family)
MESGKVIRRNPLKILPHHRMTRQLISSGSPFEEQIAYSREVVQGDWIFVSGTTGFDYATMRIAEKIEDQARQ